MIHVSTPETTAPKQFKTELQQKVYETLAYLKIPYERADTEEAITMEDCRAIDEALDMKTVKTLFLTNRRRSVFYLFITVGDKPFSTKDFAAAMHVSRPSFAPEELLGSIAGTTVGAATVFSALLDEDRDIQVVFDKDVLSEEWYGCSDGTTTSYMKLRTDDILNKFLPYTKHVPAVIEV